MDFFFSPPLWVSHSEGKPLIFHWGTSAAPALLLLPPHLRHSKRSLLGISVSGVLALTKTPPPRPSPTHPLHLLTLPPSLYFCEGHKIKIISGCRKRRGCEETDYSGGTKMSGGMTWWMERQGRRTDTKQVHCYISTEDFMFQARECKVSNCAQRKYLKLCNRELCTYTEATAPKNYCLITNLSTADYTPQDLFDKKKKILKLTYFDSTHVSKKFKLLQFLLSQT